MPSPLRSVTAMHSTDNVSSLHILQRQLKNSCSWPAWSLIQTESADGGLEDSPGGDQRNVTTILLHGMTQGPYDHMDS